MIPLDNHLYGVTIGDVSDHGVPAALFMALTTTLVRAEASAILAPDDVLREVNQHLLSMNDAGMFVTLLYGILDTDRYSFQYSRAGHEYPIIISAEGEDIPCYPKPGQPLGLFPDPVLEQSVVNIPPGSLMVLYTDGITNTFNSKRRPFGLKRLKKTLSNSPEKPPQAFIDKVWEELATYRGSVDQYDDLTLFIVKAD